MEQQNKYWNYNDCIACLRKIFLISLWVHALLRLPWCVCPPQSKSRDQSSSHWSLSKHTRSSGLGGTKDKRCIRQSSRPVPMHADQRLPGHSRECQLNAATNVDSTTEDSERGSEAESVTRQGYHCKPNITAAAS